MPNKKNNIYRQRLCNSQQSLIISNQNNKKGLCNAYPANKVKIIQTQSTE